MRKHENSTMMILVGLMVLVFWLVILFMDQALSSRHQIVSSQQHVVETSIPSQTFIVSGLVSSFTGQTLLKTSLHTVAPIQNMEDKDILSVSHSLENSEIFKDLHVLEYLYAKTKNPELLQPMIEKFLQYYQFDKANQYLSVLVLEKGGYLTLNMDPHKVIYTRLHDSSLGLDTTNALDEIFSLIQDYKISNLITADDEMFYKGLKSLWTYDYQTATAAFSKVISQRYQDFKTSYESALANYTKIKNPPAYYRDGLVALTLLKNGYFSLAKRLALRALKQHEHYILPYQVLAYANFLTHNRETAKEYFIKLMDFDADNQFIYKFLIGVCYYWYGEYEQSLLYLNQVTDPGLMIDVYRYMLLSYIQLGDTTNMVRMWHHILGEQDIHSSDFALFFDQMFFIPFRNSQPFTLYSDNSQLVDLYLGRCHALMSGDQSDVCFYGELGLQLAKQNLSSVGQQLVAFTEKYHQSHLYHLLGDYYLLNHHYDLAKDVYIKALSICDNVNEQAILKTKISQVSR